MFSITPVESLRLLQECFTLRNTHRTQCAEAPDAGLSVRCTVGVWPEQAECTRRLAPDAGGLLFAPPVVVRVSVQVCEGFCQSTGRIGVSPVLNVRCSSVLQPSLRMCPVSTGYASGAHLTTSVGLQVTVRDRHARFKRTNVAIIGAPDVGSEHPVAPCLASGAPVFSPVK